MGLERFTKGRSLRGTAYSMEFEKVILYKTDGKYYK